MIDEQSDLLMHVGNHEVITAIPVDVERPQRAANMWFREVLAPCVVFDKIELAVSTTTKQLKRLLEESTDSSSESGEESKKKKKRKKSTHHHKHKKSKKHKHSHKKRK